MPADEPISRDPGGIRSSIVVGASLVGFSLGVFVFYVVAGRILGPEAYGLAAALQGVIVVIAQPAAALQWSIARVVAKGGQTGRTDALAVYRTALIRMTLISSVLVLIAALVTFGIDAAGHSIPVGPLIATYAVVIFVIPFFLTMGVLQGEHRYSGFAWANAATGVLRLPLLLSLIALAVADVEASVLAVGIAFAIAALWGMALLRREIVTPGAPSRSAWRDFLGALPAAGIGLIGISVLTNIDVVVAKITVGGVDAGLFGAAAVIVKGLLMVPVALTVVLLPRVAEREAHGQQTGSLLAAGVTVMAIAGVAAMLLAIPLATPVTEIVFGTAFAPAAQYLVPFFGATTLLGALLILVNHHVARSDHRFAWVVGLLALVQIGALAAFGHSPYAIIAVDAAVAGLGLIIHELLYFGTSESMLRGVRSQFRDGWQRLRGGEAVD